MVLLHNIWTVGKVIIVVDLIDVGQAWVGQYYVLVFVPCVLLE